MHWSYRDLLDLPVTVYEELIAMVEDGSLTPRLGE
jgi:hypothetical protein